MSKDLLEAAGLFNLSINKVIPAINNSLLSVVSYGGEKAVTMTKGYTQLCQAWNVCVSNYAIITYLLGSLEKKYSDEKFKKLKEQLESYVENAKLAQTSFVTMNTGILKDELKQISDITEKLLKNIETKFIPAVLKKTDEKTGSSIINEEKTGSGLGAMMMIQKSQNENMIEDEKPIFNKKNYDDMIDDDDDIYGDGNDMIVDNISGSGPPSTGPDTIDIIEEGNTSRNRVFGSNDKDIINGGLPPDEIPPPLLVIPPENYKGGLPPDEIPPPLLVIPKENYTSSTVNGSNDKRNVMSNNKTFDMMLGGIEYTGGSYAQSYLAEIKAFKMVPDWTKSGVDSVYNIQKSYFLTEILPQLLEYYAYRTEGTKITYVYENGNISIPEWKIKGTEIKPILKKWISEVREVDFKRVMKDLYNCVEHLDFAKTNIETNKNLLKENNMNEETAKFRRNYLLEIDKLVDEWTEMSEIKTKIDINGLQELENQYNESAKNLGLIIMKIADILDRNNHRTCIKKVALYLYVQLTEALIHGEKSEIYDKKINEEYIRTYI